MSTDGGATLVLLSKEATGETYVLFYGDQCRDDALRTLGRWASDTDLSFNWYDAAVMAQKIRQEEAA